MNTPDNGQAPSSPAQGHLPAPELVKKLAIWALFFTLLYLTRDFFFTGFMTFLFSYMALGIISRVMKRLSPTSERPGLRRLVTVIFFILCPLVLLGVGILIAPSLLHQGKQLAGWLSHVSPESEVARLLEDFIGPEEFKRTYTGPDDPNYQNDLKAFQATKVQHVKEYQDFPNLEAWVEGGFGNHFAEVETARVRSQLLRAGVSSKEFEQWFLTVKYPELQKEAKKPPEKGRASTPFDPLIRAAATAKPEQLLDQARRDLNALGPLRAEWIKDTVEHEIAPGSPAYLADFRPYYENRVKESPTTVPYTFQQYIELQKARSQGPVIFGDTLEKLKPTKEGESQAGLRADFEAAKKHELFLEWWGSSSIAKFIRHQVEAGSSVAGSNRLESIIASLLNLPVDLGTALLLSFFICIDFPQLQRALRRLRETWLRDVYDEIAPALSNLGELIGRAMHAQGLIALCNAVLMFVALNILGIEHAVLLCCAVFVLCLVPTLGTLIAWVLLAGMALVQPGGGLILALKVSGAVFLVVLLETFVFSPRILGRMMELHPVLIISILPVAQYFFGVWGLILATPVAVYVIHVLILQRGLPGSSQRLSKPPKKENGQRKRAPIPPLSSYLQT